MRNRRAFIPVIEQASAAAPTDPAISWVFKYDFSDLAKLWKDTARSVPVTAESDQIQGVSDASGNNNHMQSVISDHPLLDLLAQNNLAGALFGGNSVMLQTDNTVSHGIGTGDFYFVALTRYTGIGNARSVWSNGQYAPVLYHWSDGTFKVYWDAYLSFTGVYDADHANHIVEFYRESGTLKLAVDGVVDPTTFDTSAKNMADAKSNIGNDQSAEPFDGHIFEVRFCASLPSAVNRTALRTFLNYKWVP